MKTSADGRAFIEAFEGLFLKTYNDGEGVLTIGYGHTTAAGSPPVVKGMTITKEQADQILASDLAKVEMMVGRIMGYPLTQSEFDALVSFEFNTGDLGKSSIPAKIRAGSKDGAMATLLLYVHGANSGQVYEGLARRRRGEKLMFMGDVAGALRVAGTQTQKQSTAPKAGAPPPQPKPAPAPAQSNWLADLIAAILSIFSKRK